MSFPDYTPNYQTPHMASGIVLCADNSGAYTDAFNTMFDEVGNRLDLYRLNPTGVTTAVMDLTGHGADIAGMWWIRDVMINNVSGLTPYFVATVDALKLATIVASGITYQIDGWTYRPNNNSTGQLSYDIHPSGIWFYTYGNGKTYMKRGDLPPMDNNLEIIFNHIQHNYERTPTYLSGYYGYVEPHRLSISDPETVSFSNTESISYSLSKEVEVIDVYLKADTDLPEEVIEDNIKISLMPSGLTGVSFDSQDKEDRDVTFRTIYWIDWNGRHYELQDVKPVYIGGDLCYWKSEAMLISQNNDPTLKIHDDFGVLYRGEREYEL